MRSHKLKLSISIATDLHFVHVSNADRVSSRQRADLPCTVHCEQQVIVHLCHRRLGAVMFTVRRLVIRHQVVAAQEDLESAIYYSL